MGYYTSFDLTILDSKGVEIDGTEIISKIRDMSPSAKYAFTEEGNTNDECKWYDWNKDFLRFSKIFPNNILMVHGDGEESDDIWVAYIMNGKIQRCPGKMTYEPLNLSLISTEKIKPRTLKT